MTDPLPILAPESDDPVHIPVRFRDHPPKGPVALTPEPTKTRGPFVVYLAARAGARLFRWSEANAANAWRFAPADVRDGRDHLTPHLFASWLLRNREIFPPSSIAVISYE